MNGCRLQSSRIAICAAAWLCSCGACADDPMVDQAKYEAYEASAFYEDGASARERIPGTVAWNAAADEDLTVWRKRDLALVRHGRERFNIYCANCHGRDGYGRGMIVQRGYPPPPSYHQQRLRQVPDEHIVAVVEKGMGKMPPFRESTTAYDRWALVAYIRALQLSQNARPSDVPDDELAALKAVSSRPAAEGLEAHDH